MTANSYILFILLCFAWTGCQSDLRPPQNNPAVSEICGDGIDNDNNGAVDCADSSCGSSPSCLSSSGCGQCPAGQACDSFSNSCYVPAQVDGEVTVVWEHPVLGYQDEFPTYIAHLLGKPLTLLFENHAACATVVNGTSTVKTVSVGVNMPLYGDERTESVSLASGASQRVCTSPLFDYQALYALRAPTPGAIVGSVTLDGESISRDEKPVSIMPVDNVLWRHPRISLHDLRILSHTLVTPDAPVIQQLLGEVNDTTRFSLYGETPVMEANWHTRHIVDETTDIVDQSFIRAGETVRVEIDTSGDIDVGWMRNGSWDKLTRGKTGSFDFTAPETDWYSFAFRNTNWVFNIDAKWRRTPSRIDRGYDLGKTIFRVLNARGISYSSISASYFEGAQQVRLAQHSLDAEAANCIDGTFLFLAIAELAQFDAMSVFVSGHAFAAVGLEQENFSYIETTLVDGGDYSQAWNSGLNRYTSAAGVDPLFYAVPLNNIRMMGVTPIPVSR